MKKRAQFDSLSEYRKTLSDPKAPFRARVEGKLTETVWSRTPCVYFESAVLAFEDGRCVGHTNTHRSGRDFSLVTGEARVAVDRGMRLYIEPTWLERDPKDPELRACLEEAKARMEAADAALAEFALLPGRDYWAKIVREEHWLPPDGPDSPPNRAHSTAIYLSDKPFVDGRPQGETAPLSNWTY
jgi:hypothetical protein